MTFQQTAEIIRDHTHYNDIVYSNHFLKIYDDYFQNHELLIRVSDKDRNLNEVSIDWMAIGKSCPMNSEIELIILVINDLLATT